MYKNIIFLDIDGVLNCQLFYEQLRAQGNKISLEIDPVRVGWLNELCKDIDAGVVISSTWRHDMDRTMRVLRENGADFDVIDATPNLQVARGVEIDRWLTDNCLKMFGIHGHNFYRYAIIDDDSDMLLQQAPHFFQTDNYSGLTPTTCYKIKRFFTHKTFD